MSALQKQNSVTGSPDCPPVLFLIFNRPDKARIVFERIREARPKQLFIAADGPRPDKPEDIRLCSETQKALLERIDWPCEVKTLFREKNLGCKLAVSSAITWFFGQVEEGIILEDDCLPDPTFFRFCAELLEKYRDDEKVMMISGDNFQPQPRGNASYYFSRFTHIWGWATWRRAWALYDLEMKKWPEFRDRNLLKKNLLPGTAKRAGHAFETCFHGSTSTWDFQWLFAVWAQGGLSIMPNINIVTNIDAGGTHMKVYDPCIHLHAQEMPFPLIHPENVAPDKAADDYSQKYILLRSPARTILLILGFLWTTLIKNPETLLSAGKQVASDLLAEAQHRRKCSAAVKKGG